MLTQIKASVQTWKFKPNRTQILRFALSFALAVLLWGWVTQLQDPYQERVFQDLAIESPSLPNELTIISALPTATVTIEGPESRVGSINRLDVLVTIDTSDISGPGTYQVDIMASAPNVSEISVSPKEITVQVDRRVSRIFPLTTSAADEADELRAIESITPEVSQVTVTGPESVVARITQVVLAVSLEQQVDDFDTAVTPYAVDATGQRISDVEILPQTVNTHVTVETRGKAVSVIPTVTGIPADGFAVQQRRTIPDTIIVDGPADILDDLLFVDTEPVDITDATEPVSAQVSVTGLPDGVTIVEPASGVVEVRVAIEDTTASTQLLSDLPVEVVGLGSGLTSLLEPAAISIQVNAPQSLLQTMQPEDISVFVDVDGLGPGTYVLEPIVTVPQGATWVGSDPATITVNISVATGSTPENAPPAGSLPPMSTPANADANRDRRGSRRGQRSAKTN